MKVEAAVECMSKSYLHKIIDSYTKDTGKLEETEARKRLVSDKELLANPENIKRRLQPDGISFDSKVLSRFILEVLLDADDYTIDENSLIAGVISHEEDILKQAQDPDVFKFKPNESINTYTTVLEVALEDGVISLDEKRLLTKLRTHLGLSLKDHYLIQAKLSKFPKPNNIVHSLKEIRSEINELQKRGVVFFCNLFQAGPRYVVPEDLVDGVKDTIGIELGKNAYQLLFDKLSRNNLKAILESYKLPTSGKKEELAERIISSDIAPSQALESLGVEDLYNLCKSLPGVNVSGTKSTRINNVINHFDNLRTVNFDENTDPREKYYDYYVELAKRDRQNLLSNNIIQKDRNMDSAFEEATRFLFEEKLGLELEKMNGSENPDGLLQFGKTKELFMWDTKSKESTYNFPNDHLNQFKRYIHNSTERVNCFLVIAPKVSEKCLDNAFRLKVESNSDTDVALIDAENLKWVAENWRSYCSNGSKFKLDVFNFTGTLDHSTLKQRMKIFLK